MRAVNMKFFIIAADLAGGSLCWSYGVSEVNVVINGLNLYQIQQSLGQVSDNQLINYPWKCFVIWLASIEYWYHSSNYETKDIDQP